MDVKSKSGKRRAGVVTIGCLLLGMGANAQSATFEWAKSMGGTGADVGSSNAVDAQGNVYTTGYFQGTVDFDPGAATYNLTAIVYNSFISKLDPLGNLVWAKNLGGPGAVMAQSITIDATGNVYTTGHFTGTADFDPGVGVVNLISEGEEDQFISKLDANGNFVWAKHIGGPISQVGSAIEVDALGNVYTTGYFEGTADFNPDAGVFNITSADSTYDIFILKLTASGNFVWAKGLGGPEHDFANSLALDKMGNVYTTGMFRGTVDFNPGVGTENLTAVNIDLFISKLDSSGNHVWAKRMGGIGMDISQDIAIDALGNVYTTGNFGLTADFDPGAGTANLTAVASNVFVSKLNASGNFVWAKNLGGNEQEIGTSIAVDALGNAYITGTFDGTTDFDPGAGTFNLTAVGDYDIFISKLDASGNFGWAKGLGGPLTEHGKAIAITTSGDIHTTGLFQGTGDYEPGPAVHNLTSNGGFDIFVHKMNTKNASGLSDKSTFANFNSYPNPSNGLFTLVVSKPLISVRIEIYNSTGALVYEKAGINGQQTIDLTNQSNGLYMIKMITADQVVTTQRIVKQ